MTVEVIRERRDGLSEKWTKEWQAFEKETGVIIDVVRLVRRTDPPYGDKYPGAPESIMLPLRM